MASKNISAFEYVYPLAPHPPAPPTRHSRAPRFHSVLVRYHARYGGFSHGHVHRPHMHGARYHDFFARALLAGTESERTRADFPRGPG
jgi:hypothetical protein